MKRKMLLIPLALIAMSLIVPVRAGPAFFVNVQAEITEFKFVGIVPEGIRFDVPFVGVAGGPYVKGTVTGVDYLLIDWGGIPNLNVHFTITDKEGDKLSIHVTGKSIAKNPGQSIFEETTVTIINEPDYPTTGKYSGWVGKEVRGEGFLTDLSMDPPGGYIHVKLYWD